MLKLRAAAFALLIVACVAGRTVRGEEPFRYPEAKHAEAKCAM